jgi:1,4-alpha-glucan branching enzyme
MPLSDDIVRAICEGRLGDPFSVLGLHKGNDGVSARIWLRSAERVEVISDDGRHTAVLAERAPGLFEGVFAGVQEPFAYRVRVTDAGGGAPLILRDPYSFWPQLADFDLELFRAGHHLHLGEVMGAHVLTVSGVSGVRFAVWAPNAARVSVIGDWNGFDGRWHPMRRRDPFGIWELFIPDVTAGMLYKFEIRSKEGELRIKSDPYARAAEEPPATASVVVGNDRFGWKDGEWLAERRTQPHLNRPMAIYECHLGSWMRGPEPGATWPSYRELAERLIAHCQDYGFTHLELLPVAQHPYEGSWGYQVTGQYAPNSRHGGPADFKQFISLMHEAGISVIVDFVPGHFPKDDFALARFDGEACYEYSDPREGEHRTWGTCVFNFRRPEVRNFLIAAALHWLREFHIDALRVDAVSSMLYRNYDRSEGEWVPNEQGGIANLEAVSFLQELTSTIHREFPGVLMIAEESTAWQGVTAPTELQGLGFDLKWNMGWMHDTLRYLAQDPVMRPGCQEWITFHQWYAYDDRWVLPLSHDEVVHGKKSLLDKMSGDYWQRIAQLRLLFGYQVGVPGRPLLFQGAEFGQGREWAWNRSVDWGEGLEPLRRGLGEFLRAALRAYAEHPALYERDDHRDGFQWVDCENRQESVLAFLRKAPSAPDVLVACNFTPIARHGYRLGVPMPGRWHVILDSDAKEFGGSGIVNGEQLIADDHAHGVFRASVRVTLPPLGIVLLRAPSPAHREASAPAKKRLKRK